ncbi:autophagy-related protein 13-like isoform X5 [Pleurodeles waltl]|uniref:autophagy-related protein 13-like isoform X5 n=1 Tax=Pleurodeles waltl TaxID=8319 RepID=UPI0037097C74
MDSDLNAQDRKDLDKFIKFFALKTVQVIVQSRLGEKICTRSSSSPTGSDWFNLAIKDIPEVTHESKKALAGQLPAVGRSMCVEISLKTSEGDSMELEIWCLEMNEKCDRDIKVSYSVYNRLSLLLKSLLAITRVTPAYRLSRKQGHEYVILYRVYFGEVQLNGLGEGFQTVRAGTVGTPIGTITLSCAYRTNLAFMSGRAMTDDTGAAYPVVEESQEVCTTSFSTSPPSQCTLTVSNACLQTPAVPVVTDTLRVPVMGVAFSQHMVLPRRDSGMIPSLPQAVHGTLSDQHRHGAGAPASTAACSAVTPSSSEDAETNSNCSEGQSSSPSKPTDVLFVRKVGAFVDKPSPQVTYASTDIPFSMFVTKSGEPVLADCMVKAPDSPEEVSPLPGSLQSSSNSSGNVQDDFVMVDFRPAFCKDDIFPFPMDVGTFYREFQNPPQLSSLSVDIGAQSMAEDLDSLPEKLAMHEKKMEEFNAFVESLQ